MPATAVYLSPDGLGQALIYPHYTVRAAGGNPYHTYIAVTNTDTAGKVVRVRFREGRNGREVGSFNLYLAGGDMWTGALVPDGEGAKVVSADGSCTEPALASTLPGVTELALQSATYSGANSDTLGEGLDRTREGYVEMIEMASVRPGSPTAAAIAQQAGGRGDCSFVRATPSRVFTDIDPPRGLLMGSLTLINVASGRDSTLNAEALAALSTQPFFRPAADPYPDFDAAEITPASVVVAGGRRFRLAWARGVDAVSSVLMQISTSNEYVLDTSAGSLTDWVTTLPTRRFYRSAASATPPFTFGPPGPACEEFNHEYFDRETQGATRGGGIDFPWPHPPPPALCRGSTVSSVLNEARHMAPLFGSANATPSLPVSGHFQNGWAYLAYTTPAAQVQGLVSLATSNATDLATGATTTGAFRVLGLPVVGFIARSFNHGTLMCSGGNCQGNYGSAFPHHGARSVVPAP